MNAANDLAACNGGGPPNHHQEQQQENHHNNNNNNNNNNNVNVNNNNNNNNHQPDHQQQDQQQQQQVANREVNKDCATVNGFTGSSNQQSGTRSWRSRRRVNKSSICLTIILVTLFVILTLKLVVYIKYNRI